MWCVNTDRELRILRATRIEGIVENFENQMKMEKVKILLINVMYLLMLLLLISITFFNSFNMFLIIMILIMIDFFIAFFWEHTRGRTGWSKGWGVTSQYIIILNFLGMLILVAVGLPVSALGISHIAGFPFTFVLIFTIIGLIPLLAMPVILKFAKKQPLSLSKRFKGPYSKEEFKKIIKSLSEECGEVKRSIWTGEYDFNCEGFKASLTRISLNMGYKIHIVLYGVDENNASRVRVVVEKIDKMLIK